MRLEWVLKYFRGSRTEKVTIGQKSVFFFFFEPVALIKNEVALQTKPQALQIVLFIAMN